MMLIFFHPDAPVAFVSKAARRSFPTMATYVDWVAFREAILATNFVNRVAFLSIVKHCHVVDSASLPNNEATRALLACQALRLVPQDRRCPHCNASFRLYYKMRLYRWCGPRYDEACHDCHGKEYSATALGFLRHVKPDLWMPKLECFIMWIHEYPRQLMLRELHPLSHKRMDPWLMEFQEAISNWFENQLSFGLDGPIFQGLENTSTRTSVSTRSDSKMKRPSSSSVVYKKPSVTKTISKAKGKGRILIADETHLNKRKPSILAKYGRPQRDHIWLWGAVLQGHVNTHFIFRILDHPEDAYDGKPRGHKEMVKNLGMLNLKKNDIFVSDKWKATVSAMKSFRREHNFSLSDVKHEIVNHSKGELKNSNGFTTNPIECKWSLIKDGSGPGMPDDCLSTQTVASGVCL